MRIPDPLAAQAFRPHPGEGRCRCGARPLPRRSRWSAASGSEAPRTRRRPAPAAIPGVSRRVRSSHGAAAKELGPPLMAFALGMDDAGRGSLAARAFPPLPGEGRRRSGVRPLPRRSRRSAASGIRISPDSAKTSAGGDSGGFTALPVVSRRDREGTRSAAMTLAPGMDDADLGPLAAQPRSGGGSPTAPGAASRFRSRRSAASGIHCLSRFGGTIAARDSGGLAALPVASRRDGAGTRPTRRPRALATDDADPGSLAARASRDSRGEVTDGAGHGLPVEVEQPRRGSVAFPSRRRLRGGSPTPRGAATPLAVGPEGRFRDPRLPGCGEDDRRLHSGRWWRCRSAPAGGSRRGGALPGGGAGGGRGVVWLAHRAAARRSNARISALDQRARPPSAAARVRTIRSRLDPGPERERQTGFGFGEHQFQGRAPPGRTSAPDSGEAGNHPR